MTGISLLLSDVDGTLVRSDKTLSPRSVDAVNALRVADYAAVMDGGRVVATGEPAEILATMSDVILGGAA